MILVFKRTLRPLSITILAGGILISYGYLKMIGINDLPTMYQTIFAGKPLHGIRLKSLFLMVVLLLQYVHIDGISFYIDNAESLFIRYGSKSGWLKHLFRETSILTAMFVLLFYLIWLLLEVIFNKSDIIPFTTVATLVLIARVYLFCTIITLIQIYLLLKWGKSSTFMLITAISIFLAIISRYQGSIISVLPQPYSSSLVTLLHAIGNILLACLFIAIIKKVIFKKELNLYGN